MFDVLLEKEIFSLTIKLMKSKSLGLNQIKDFNPELRDTIANYSMMTAILPIEGLEYYRYIEETYDSNDTKFDFVCDRLEKFENLGVENVWKSLKSLSKVNDEAHKHDFKLMQDMILIYLGRGQSWQKVKKMRGWSMWMQLKMRNKSLIVHELYAKLNLVKVIDKMD